MKEQRDNKGRRSMGEIVRGNCQRKGGLRGKTKNICTKLKNRTLGLFSTPCGTVSASELVLGSRVENSYTVEAYDAMNGTGIGVRGF
jgi:hypothetical protein